MKTKLSFFVFLFLGLILINIFLPVSVIAYQTRETTSSEINFFYSTVCPHCKEELKFLNELEKKYPQIKINRYEVIYNKENREILKKFYEQYRVPLQEQGYVPLTFTRTKYFVGFNISTVFLSASPGRWMKLDPALNFHIPTDWAI